MESNNTLIVKSKGGRPRLSDEELIRRAEERKIRYREERRAKRKEKNENFKTRWKYDEEGNVISRNYIYKTVKTPDMSKQEYEAAIINEIIETPLSINSKDSIEFSEFRKQRQETGEDLSLELFDKEIDKWPLF